MARVKNLREQIRGAEHDVEFWKKQLADYERKSAVELETKQTLLASAEQKLLTLKAELLKPEIDKTVGAIP